MSEAVTESHFYGQMIEPVERGSSTGGDRYGTKEVVYRYLSRSSVTEFTEEDPRGLTLLS